MTFGRRVLPISCRSYSWCLLCCALMTAAADAKEPSECPAVPAVVSQASASEFAIACEAARVAAQFLQAAGAQVPSRIQIDVVAAMPPGVPADAPGCYSVRTRRVFLLQWVVFERRRTWLGVAADLALYRSVATHEVAHAIARCQKPARSLSRLAHEYLANVTMYATMEPALRERMLAAHPGTGYEHERQINILDYLFDPALFGADAYRHWTQQVDRAGFLRRVLEGKVIVEMERD